MGLIGLLAGECLLLPSLGFTCTAGGLNVLRTRNTTEQFSSVLLGLNCMGTLVSKSTPTQTDT